MKKLYIISTVGGFDMEASDIKTAVKQLHEHASRHPNIKMGLYELIQTNKLSKYSNGRVRWQSEIKVSPRVKKS